MVKSCSPIKQWQSRALGISRTRSKPLLISGLEHGFDTLDSKFYNGFEAEKRLTTDSQQINTHSILRTVKGAGEIRPRGEKWNLSMQLSLEVEASCLSSGECGYERHS